MMKVKPLLHNSTDGTKEKIDLFGVVSFPWCHKLTNFQTFRIPKFLQRALQLAQTIFYFLFYQRSLIKILFNIRKKSIFRHIS